MRAMIVENSKAIDAVVLPDDWTGSEGEWQPPAGTETVASDTALIGDNYDGETFTTPEPPPTPIEELRERKAEEIKQHGLSLIQSQIPAIDSYEMVAFMRVLWPTLTDPASQPGLAYARDVYLYAVEKLDQLQTATREQIEGYVPKDDPNWP